MTHSASTSITASDSTSGKALPLSSVPYATKDFDTKGDHLFQCAHLRRYLNTKLHHKWRDTLQSLIDRIMPLINLTNTKAKTEQTGLVRPLKNTNLRPFDTHFDLPPISKDSHYRCKLRKIGFDIVHCNSDTCPPPSRGGSDAKSNNIITSLLTAEKSKFQRGKSRNSAVTCKQSGITLSGDEIIGQLFDSKAQLLPFAISPLGLFGPTMNHFLYGVEPIPHHIDKNTFPHAYNMAKQSISTAVPSDILHRANEVWRTQHPNKFFGGSYKSPDPLTYVTQQFGREVCFTNGSSGLAAISLLGPGPMPKSSPTTSIDDTLHQTTACTNTEAFRRLNGETSRTHTTTTNAGIANVGGTQSITT